MKVNSLGFNPNLGKEFMQRHGASFVIAQRDPSQTKSSSASPAQSEAELEESQQLGALRIARMRHQNAQFAAQSTKQPD